MSPTTVDGSLRRTPSQGDWGTLYYGLEYDRPVGGSAHDTSRASTTKVDTRDPFRPRLLRDPISRLRWTPSGEEQGR